MSGFVIPTLPIPRALALAWRGHLPCSRHAPWLSSAAHASAGAARQPAGLARPRHHIPRTLRAAAWPRPTGGTSRHCNAALRRAVATTPARELLPALGQGGQARASRCVLGGLRPGGLPRGSRFAKMRETHALARIAVFARRDAQRGDGDDGRRHDARLGVVAAPRCRALQLGCCWAASRGTGFAKCGGPAAAIVAHCIVRR